MPSDGDIATMKRRLGWLLVLLTGGQVTSATTVAISTLAETSLYESVGTTVDVGAMPLDDVKKELETTQRLLRLISDDELEQSSADRYLRQLAVVVSGGHVDRSRIAYITGQLRLARVRLSQDVVTVGQWLRVARAVEPDVERFVIPTRFIRHRSTELDPPMFPSESDTRALELASDMLRHDDADTVSA